ncbi:MAG: cysteine desulfurase family protein [Candidatus Marinimicrobia bacterium]|nr:cysteine desulfurase family protein [Candidatus Neomarinimicrobiota bacterium]
MIYLDNSATTPLHPKVKEAIRNVLDLFGNPSSMHSSGRQVRAMLEESRKDIADFLNCSPDEIIFTAGASEANNTVLKSATTCCAFCSDSRGHIITSNIEHPSVLNTLKCLENQHVEVTHIKVNNKGLIDPADIEAAIRPDTMMISIMYVNNEIGTIQPIQEIAEIAKKHNIPMHTDAVQAIGKIPIDLQKLPVDFLSMSGHKIYAPKGIGILFKRKTAKNICPLITGGHQENSMRAGTENTLGIVALGEAIRQCKLEMKDNKLRIGQLRDRLENGIIKNLDHIIVNGDPAKRVYNITNLSFMNIEGESILLRLDMHGIAVSTGSACSTGSLEPSYVITALEVDPEIAHSSIRFSLSRETTEEEIDKTIEAVTETVKFFRKMSPIL